MNFSNCKMDKIRFIEKEMSRIEKVSRKIDFNPVDILDLTLPFGDDDIKSHYRKIVRLIHPDKNDNNSRFCQAFTIVNDSYGILLNPQKKSLCIKSIKLKQSDLLKKLFQKEEQPQGSVNHDNNQRQIVLWDPQILSTYVLKNNIQKEQYKVNVNIAIDGSEHTKNKSKSKSDKHQKGLKQRATQKKNAHARIKNHSFSFTDKVTIELIPEKKD